jgi:phosphatidylinositol-4,5-bisphosphate 3-kinase
MIKCSHYGDDLNQITFSFVWILFRAEMDVQEISLKFGLMLETYLRGSVNHIPELRKQMDAIGKMRSISELLHSRPFKDKDKREKAKEAMQQLLAQYGYQQVINNCVSTLNPKLKLGNVK